MNQPIARVRQKQRTGIVQTIAPAVISLLFAALIGLIIQESAMIRVDRSLGSIVQSVLNETLNEIARWFDWIGSTAGYAVITAITAILLLLRLGAAWLFIVLHLHRAITK